MPRKPHNGVRFQVGGIAEQALEALQSRRQHIASDHHARLAEQDHQRALAKLPEAKERLSEAEAALAAAALGEPRAAAEKAHYAAKVHLKNIERAIAVTAARYERHQDWRGDHVAERTETDPITGKPKKASEFRAPSWAGGPAEQLAREEEARGILQAIDEIVARGEMLPNIAEHHARRRMLFPHFIDSPPHTELQLAYFDTAEVRTYPDHVQALWLYVQREARYNGIPLVVGLSPEDQSKDFALLFAEHALWGELLPIADQRFIVEIVESAAIRLHLPVKACLAEGRYYLFEVGWPLDKAIDYKHIAEKMRRRTPKNPLDDEDAWQSPDAPTSEPADRIDPAQWLHSETARRADEDAALARYLETGFPQLSRGQRSELPEWADPRPDLDRSGLPYSLARLFHVVALGPGFDRVPPQDMTKRSPGPAWWTAAGDYTVSRHEVAEELFQAAITGDLPRMQWDHQHICAHLWEGTLNEVLAITNAMIAEVKRGERHGVRKRPHVHHVDDAVPVLDTIARLFAKVRAPVRNQPPADLAARTSGPSTDLGTIAADLFVAIMHHDRERADWIDREHLSHLSPMQRYSVYRRVVLAVARVNRNG